MQLASKPVLSQPPLAAMPQLSEKPRQGFATKKTAWNPGPNVCNFTVTLGLQVVVSENGVRKTYSARYYNPHTGRFMSRDPEDGNFWDPKSLHKYLYADGDPVNAMDPRGREAGEEYSVVNFDLVEGGSKLSPLEEFGQTSARILCRGIETVAKITKRASRLVWAILESHLKAYTTVRGYLYRFRLLAERLKKMMKFVRSDTPKVARGIASASFRANRRFPAFIYSGPLNALILLITIAVSLIVSAGQRPGLALRFFLHGTCMCFGC